MESTPQRRIVVLMLPGVLSLDAFGPYEAFSYASVLRAQRLQGVAQENPTAEVPDHLRAYEVLLTGLAAGPVMAASRTQLYASHSTAAFTEPFDTLLVAGGDPELTYRVLIETGEALQEVRRLATLARRVAATCTGAFVLAFAGLLDGRRATSHWNACEVLGQLFPKVQVDARPIYVQDDRFYTSAGGTTNIDLALALISEDLGPALANSVARHLVLYVQRPAAQAQLSAPLICQRAETRSLRDLQDWILEHLADDLSVTALAAQVGMSERNFGRSFRREVGMTPARYVESLRVEAGLRKLRLGNDGIERIAADVGFPCAETFRRACVRCYGEGPAEIRRNVVATSGG